MHFILYAKIANGKTKEVVTIIWVPEEMKALAKEKEWVTFTETDSL